MISDSKFKKHFYVTSSFVSPGFVIAPLIFLRGSVSVIDDLFKFPSYAQ